MLEQAGSTIAVLLLFWLVGLKFMANLLRCNGLTSTFSAFRW